MTRPPDKLRFWGGVADGMVVGWNGPWPPPEEMIGFTGSESGITTITEPRLVPSEVWEAVAEVGSIQHTRYRRRNASKLPDDFASDFVFRGADYTQDELTE